MKKLLISLAAVVVIAIVAIGSVFVVRDYRFNHIQTANLPPDTDFTQLKQTPIATASATSVASKPTTASVTPVPKASTPPAALNLKAPFYAQAPLGNWDYPWQEACEEASVLLAANEYFGHGWTVAQFNQQILDIVEWENKTFGDYKHTTMAQTSQMLKDYLKLDSKIHENPDLSTIKQILANGHFIILPFAGKEVGNPYYNNGGPTYHVVLAKGYTADNQIITHDVGTKHGENYVYDWETISAALHDYSDPIDNGARRIIEVFPPQA